MHTRFSGAKVGVASSKELLDLLPFLMDMCPVSNLNEEDNNTAICKFGRMAIASSSLSR